jgi:hypothetical protein
MTTDLYLDFLGLLGIRIIYQTPIGFPELLSPIWNPKCPRGPYLNDNPG